MGTPAALTLAAVDVASATAAMSREEKLAFAKKLKEERKALYTELGIEEEPKPAKEPPSAAPKGAVPTAPTPVPPPSAAYQVAFKCLGFLFTMSVAHETAQDSDRSDNDGDVGKL